MKLSELSTDRALDILCELTPSVASIMEDEEILSALDNITSTDKPDDSEKSHLDGIKMMGGMVKIAPVLLKTHRPEVYNILSVMNEQPVAGIAAQPIKDTIQQVRELFQDNDLLSFFKSSAQRGQSGQSAPSVGSPGSE